MTSPPGSRRFVTRASLLCRYARGGTVGSRWSSPGGIRAQTRSAAVLKASRRWTRWAPRSPPSTPSMAEEKRLESIDFLKELLAKGDAEGERKAEMMLRLADLYFEQGRYLYLARWPPSTRSTTSASTPRAATPRSCRPTTPSSEDWQRSPSSSTSRSCGTTRGTPAPTRRPSTWAPRCRTSAAATRPSRHFTKLVKSYPDSGLRARRLRQHRRVLLRQQQRLQGAAGLQEGHRLPRARPSTASPSTSWRGATTTSASTARASTP